MVKDITEKPNNTRMNRLFNLLFKPHKSMGFIVIPCQLRMAFTYVIVVITLLSIIIPAVSLPNNVSPVVHTKLGDIVGTTDNVHIKGTRYEVQPFLGIPYAKPPVGELRFKKPEPIGIFETTYNATKFGSSCPHIAIADDDLRKSDIFTEDCLYLNIFVPRSKSNNEQGQAVMVYFHGDGPVLGDTKFVPDILAAYGDVIVVTLNYRTGILGYLSLGVDNGRGNLGLWDQHLAIRWVHDNIEAFGGDKSRVTLFGHSTGATSVVYQSLYHGNKGLFHRIISQSGKHLLKSNIVKDPSAQFSAVSKALGCDDFDFDDGIECLQSLSLNQLTAKLLDLKPSSKIMDLQFLPNIDSDFFITDPSETQSLSKSQNNNPSMFHLLDILVGFNSHDSSFFGNFLEDNLDTFNPSSDDFESKCLESVIRIANLEMSPIVAEIITAEYMEFHVTDERYSTRDICSDIITDIMFAVGSLEVARAHTHSHAPPPATQRDTKSASSFAGMDESLGEDMYGNTYVYHFTAAPSQHILTTPCWIHGAGHGDELQYIFGIPDESSKCKHSFFSRNPKQWEIELSYQMMTFWTNFVKTGNPNQPIHVSPVWPSHDYMSRGYLEISDVISGDSGKYHLHDRQLRFWTTVLPYVRDASLYNLTESCLTDDEAMKDQENDFTCDLN